MKHTKLCLLILAVLLAGVATAFTPQLVRFEWTYEAPTMPPDSQGTEGSADYFILYSSDDVQVPLTNWTRGAVFAANSNGITVTNFSVPVVPGKKFFYLTASNSWWKIESGPSNITNTPPIPQLPSKMTIKRP